MKAYAIIVAGGSGSRMNAQVPKQFLVLKKQPVLMHTISAFYNSGARPEIILSLNPGYLSYWQDLCRKYNFEIPHHLVAGGEQRFHSVQNALNLVQQDSLVAVHDAVRPIVSESLIERCFELAKEKGTAIPVVGSRDSLRTITGTTTKALRREDILIVQTPQVFRSQILKQAYQQEFSEEYTDDASVVEKAGYSIEITAGDYKNIKITWPEDLEIASLFLAKDIKKSG